MKTKDCCLAKNFCAVVRPVTIIAVLVASPIIAVALMMFAVGTAMAAAAIISGLFGLSLDLKNATFPVADGIWDQLLAAAICYIVIKRFLALQEQNPNAISPLQVLGDTLLLSLAVFFAATLLFALNPLYLVFDTNWQAAKSLVAVGYIANIDLSYRQIASTLCSSLLQGLMLIGIHRALRLTSRGFSLIATALILTASAATSTHPITLTVVFSLLLILVFYAECRRSVWPIFGTIFLANLLLLPTAKICGLSVIAG